jgi:hypothetical protein
MSLFKRGDTWHYDFWFLRRRCVGTTRQTVKTDAGICEQEVKRRIRRQSAGLEAPPAAEAPRFQDWAEVHFRERRPQMTRPEFLEDNLRVICASGARGPRSMGTPTIRIMTSASAIRFAIRNGSSGSRPGCGVAAPRRRRGITTAP